MRRELLTLAQRWKVADYLAATRLPSINAKLEPVTPRDTLYTRVGKRIIDIGVSSVVLGITLPINAVFAVATLIDVGRPILFRQKRAGKDGITFDLVKFRNMTNQKDERGELLPASERVTAWGKIMRKSSLDELLNFWSILKGDMSIIGPRPLPPEYVGRYNRRHRARLAVNPGLECPPRHLAQDRKWTWQEQFDNDVWYVEHVSLRTDLYLVLCLVRYALDRRSKETRASAMRGTFMGYDENGTAITFEELPQAVLEAALEDE